ncbi:hypothetical protein QBC46DRAFT_409450 [Diplogelasinospora grovesii]|uniref:Uncharacterized protein n=1 Tax=Diplogelasinospora grovesii TaxID=303347 RepID=A0AAN6N6A5_9PEZI|nr:hypothetical protein QBC46DRAFT_409450 [Diplogelasinospora grovesii]
MYFAKFLALAPLLSLASAGVAIVGFTDTGTCNSGVGETIITQDGQCTTFNTGYNGIQVAGGGSDSCFLQVFFDTACNDQSPSNIGPINNPNLGGCIGPFPVTGGGFSTPIRSGKLINCPT